MKIVIESILHSGETDDLENVLLSLERLGFVQAHQQLPGGSYLVDVEDDLMRQYSAVALFFGQMKRGPRPLS